MSDKNVILHQFNGSGYDNLYPKISNSCLPSPMVVSKDPTSNLGVATKQYVDNNLNTINSNLFSTIIYLVSNNSNIQSIIPINTSYTFYSAQNSLYTSLSDYFTYTFTIPINFSNYIVKIIFPVATNAYANGGIVPYNNYIDTITKNGIQIYTNNVYLESVYNGVRAEINTSLLNLNKGDKIIFKRKPTGTTKFSSGCINFNGSPTGTNTGNVDINLYGFQFS